MGVNKWRSRKVTATKKADHGLYLVMVVFIISYTVKLGHYSSTPCVTIGTLLGHVSKIVSILLSKLSYCPNTDTSLCSYCYSRATKTGQMTLLQQRLYYPTLSWIFCVVSKQGKDIRVFLFLDSKQ